MVILMDVCIKNVDDDAWRLFKSESARKGYKMGEYFSEIVKENIKRNSGWDILLNKSKKPISDEEAEIMKTAMKEMRRDFKFRDT